MDKIGDFFDTIRPLVEASDFDREHGALLLLGADLNHECAVFQGKAKCLVAMVCSAMEERKELEQVILKAVEVFLSRKEENDHGKTAMS